MSYILDALKKNERERGVARVPTLATVHEFEKERRGRVWIIGGAFLLGAALAAWFLLPGLRNASRPGEPTRAGVDSGPTATLPEETPVITEAPVASTPTAALTPREKATGAPAEALLFETAKTPPSATARRLPENAPATILSDDITAIPPEASRAAVASFLSVKAQMEEEAQQDAGEYAAEDDAPVEDTDPASAIAPAKPLSLREAIQGLKISILVYDEDSAGRLVFINGRKYAEGDPVEGAYLLESITPDGAVLSYEGEQILLKLRSD